MFLDVHLELDPLELAIQADPVRVIAEISRLKAEEMCLAHGKRLRHPEPVDVYSRNGIKFETGQDVFLVATRWIVDDGRD